MVHIWNFLKSSHKLLLKTWLVSIQGHLHFNKEITTLRIKMDHLLKINKSCLHFKISTLKDTWFYSKEDKVQLSVQKIHHLPSKTIVTQFWIFMKKVQKEWFLLIAHTVLHLGKKKKKLKSCNLNLSKVITTLIIKCVYGLKNLNLLIFSKMLSYLLLNQTLQELKWKSDIYWSLKFKRNNKTK